VTVAFTLTRHFPLRDAFAYVAAQLAGASVGALVLLAAWSEKGSTCSARSPAPHLAPSPTQLVRGEHPRAALVADLDRSTHP
jgi:glycerol uptake facilitator-like aquaporin